MAPLVSRFGRFSPPAAWGRSEILIAEIPELGDRPPPLHVGDVWSPGALLTGVRVDVQGFRPVVVVAAVGSRPPVRRNIRSITLRAPDRSPEATERTTRPARSVPRTF